MQRRIINTSIFLLTLSLSGCGGCHRTVAQLTGYFSECIDGVVYYQFSSGATVAYTKEGKVKTCEK